MAIPTREMFESFYKDHEWIVEEELEKFKYTYIESERAELIETVTNWYSKRQSYLKKIDEHELFAIFETQSSWKRAVDALFGKKTKPKPKRSLEEIIEIVEKQYVSIKDDDFSKQNYWFYTLVSRDPAMLEKEIFNAFYTYFYKEKWTDIATLSPLVEDYFEQASKALENLIKLSVLNEFADRKHIQPVSLTSLKVDFESLLKENRIIFHTPVTRKDKTLKERGLVYDLSKIFRRHFRNNKAKAIYLFLELDGVENSLELRTIDRLLKKWKQDRLKVKANLKDRQLS